MPVLKSKPALCVMPGKQVFYTNLASLCALDVHAASRIGRERIDAFAMAIIDWFWTAQSMRYEARLERLSNQPESVLRSYLHLGLQCEFSLLQAGDEEKMAAIERLVKDCNQND